ncbi:FRG domain-containing protein [Acinetobacter faecalis]|uniref:FRG domain-containing protein n=1 Tax=Acinetobacter faecalis TaxID=2665161 RepID=UPI002A908E09|nr:FRG domain-containing protein [Acinetobacter faecalis]MDY6484360.1 FRG domain-containing protein [Acinetobacter faecalis]MDY6488549.1 FRG domain-containing protein [Acinetobacter faecalis]
MAYFNLLQCYSEYEIDTLDNELISITYSTSRFVEHTDEAIRQKFKDLTNESFLILRNFPCIICFENFKDFIAIAELQDVKLNEKNKTITAILKLISEKVEINPYIEETNKFLKICNLDELEKALNFDGWEKTRTHWAIKNSNLFEKLAPLDIFSNLEEIKENFPNQTIDLLNPTKNIGKLKAILNTNISIKITGTNTPKYIKDVPDFITRVIKINQIIDEKKENREVFYRGHGKFSYQLLPSLLREDPNGKGKAYLEGEHLLFRELLTMEPNSFSNDISGFDILTRMQHYGMPTRMLDISSNPLTALYFACENLKHDEDGEVVLISVKKNDICFFDSDKISCLTNLAKLTSNQKDQLSQYIINCQKNDLSKVILNESDLNEKVYEQYLHCILNEKPYFKPKIEIKDLKNTFCVKGRLNQERIIAQSGSFLIFGLDADAIPENGNDDFNVYRIRVKKVDKKPILDELDLLNINQRTVYPSIENSAKYIKNRLENFKI